MSFFRFKRFSVKNDISAMKVNTDGVLLGAWMQILPDDRTLLDIGTGTGVIALMAAQRMADMAVNVGTLKSGRSEPVFSSDYAISAIDIDADSVTEAAANFKASVWNSALRAEHISLKQLIERFESVPLQVEASSLCRNKFDLIFSNPPYFIDSLKAPQKRRSESRHTDTLPQEEIIDGALKLLSPKGRLAVIYPIEEGMAFICKARKKGMYLIRLCRVSTFDGCSPKRIMAELSMTDLPCVEESLTIQNESDYTEEYKSLSKDFYLKF
ncbi:MAG: methyltransferase domain-containing protein [Bacteroidales bacterium]|nr:methyltransferase domain-containing protein [Bacteroidales bacterium]MDD4670591.1 methyltransferase domain-containing protein [Bacteroidales bacterium]